MYLTVVKKVRFGAALILSCPSHSSMTSGTYNWTKDNTPITAQTRGIAFDTIHTSNLTIISMTQQLEGIYHCLLNGSVREIFDVKNFGKLLYHVLIIFDSCHSVQA